MYSTIDYASKQGYPTFVIDRIGVGNSTRPDPILQQQIYLEEAVNHVLVGMLKAGTAIPGKPFDIFSLRSRPFPTSSVTHSQQVVNLTA